jgi:hypothetical protein
MRVWGGKERWCAGVVWVNQEAVERSLELRSDRQASLSRRGVRRAWEAVLGRPGQGYSSCSRNGSARSTRIRAGSSQGAAQELRMKAMAPRTPNS